MFDSHAGILKDLHPETLQSLHLGIIKTKLLAHQNMYWLRMEDDIKELVQQCGTCNRSQDTPPMEIQYHIEIQKPGQVYGTDVFELKGVHYLTIINYFSSYIL